MTASTSRPSGGRPGQRDGSGARSGGSSGRKPAPPRGGGGRVTPSKRSAESSGGRYTPPIPRTVKRSPRWYPWVLLTLLVLGIMAIILNYTYVAPGSPNSGYLVGGILAILVAALMATRYR
jgi:hypothetical protein